MKKELEMKNNITNMVVIFDTLYVADKNSIYSIKIPVKTYWQTFKEKLGIKVNN